MRAAPTTSPTDLLPELAGIRRPRLREATPVLWRSAGAIAIGEHSVVDRVSREDVSWLTSLDGARTAERVAADLPIDPTQARRLLRAAIAGIALEDAAALPGEIRWAAPEGRPAAWGRLGAAIDATGSVAAGHAALAAREQCTVSVVGTGTLAEQVRAALGWAGLRLAAGPTATVTIVTGEHHVDLAPDSATTPAGPHLAVTVWGRRAVVGPVIEPGRVGCARCHQLHLRDADPAWPLLAVQWSRARDAICWPPVDPLLGGLAAALGAHAVREWANEPSAPRARCAVEVALPDLVPVVRTRPPHPLCGCQWSQIAT